MSFINGSKVDLFGVIYGLGSDLNENGHTDPGKAVAYSDMLEETEKEENSFDNDTDDDFADDHSDDSNDDLDDDTNNDPDEDDSEDEFDDVLI